MGRQFCLVDFAGDGGGDDGGGILIPDIVLHDKDGANAPLLTPHDGG